MDRLQLNVRADPDLMRKVEQKRLLLAGELGYIPSRSDVVRMALDQYLAGVEVPKAATASRGRGKISMEKSVKATRSKRP